MLVTLWTERDFCIISDCRNLFTSQQQTQKLNNNQKVSLVQEVHSLEQSLKEKRKGLLVCVPFLLGSICKY